MKPCYPLVGPSAVCTSPKCTTNLDTELKEDFNHLEPPPETNVTFYSNDAFGFFSQRLEDKNSPLLDQIYYWNDLVLNAKNPVETYFQILNQEIYDMVKIVVPKYDPELFYWPSENDSKYLFLWSLREAIVCLSFSCLYNIVNRYKITDFVDILPNKTRPVYNEVITATILGSAKFSSDIDITIVAKHGSSAIAILEDLWQAIPWFIADSWKVNLYGDFMMIGDYYIDIHFLSNDINQLMLKMSIASYFRHEDSNLFKTEILKIIVQWCIDYKKLSVKLEDIIFDAANLVTDLDITDREKYYYELGLAENLETEIIDDVRNNVLNPAQISHLFGDILVQLATANLYREDNYLLPSTIVHIVKIEQGNEIAANRCDPILTKVARCSMNSFGFALSAIEQLGYLQEKDLENNQVCSLETNKYFGRFLRAVCEIPMLVKDAELYKELLDLNREITETGCSIMTNKFYNLLSDLF